MPSPASRACSAPPPSSSRRSISRSSRSSPSSSIGYIARNTNEILRGAAARHDRRRDARRIADAVPRAAACRWLVARRSSCAAASRARASISSPTPRATGSPATSRPCRPSVLDRAGAAPQRRALHVARRGGAQRAHRRWCRSSELPDGFRMLVGRDIGEREALVGRRAAVADRRPSALMVGARR